MLIWGFRWKTLSLGQIAYICSQCSRSTVHTAIVERGRLTILFIPLIPIGSGYRIVCNLCGLRLRAAGEPKGATSRAGAHRATRAPHGPNRRQKRRLGQMTKINFTVGKSSALPVRNEIRPWDDLVPQSFGPRPWQRKDNRGESYGVLGG